ncbi:MAG TPA: flagellar assembly protein FliX [Methylomirabilota bacterium]|nr:flagellar assembly protein FliX [Methylomirabilota bacterium]
MRITGPNRTTAPQVGSGSPRTSTGGGAFAPASADPAPRATATTAAGGLSGLDALIALQAIDADKPRGRRRAVKRGHDLLDVLDQIKIGLLSGQVSGAALDRIVDLLGDREPSGDEAVDALVSEIALRAEVELAKLGRFLPQA